MLDKIYSRLTPKNDEVPITLRLHQEPDHREIMKGAAEIDPLMHLLQPDYKNFNAAIESELTVK